MAVSRKVYVLTAIFALALPFSGCGESPSGPLQPSEAENGLIGSTLRLVGQLLPILDTVSEETIGPEGGTLEIAGGHSVYFPAGALDDTITISAVRDPLRILVDFGPEGLVFPDSAKPVLTYSYASTGLLGLLNPGGFEIVYLDGLLVEEVLFSQIDTQAKVVRAELSHFSTYALATD
jgi:hypothetical protein